MASQGNEVNLLLTGEEDEVSTISGATLEKAKKELNEDPETRMQAISELRRRINEAETEQTEFQFSRKDGKFLLRFLRARKFDIDKALKLYINYHAYRHKYVYILEENSPESVKHIFEYGVMCPIDEPMRDGSKCVVSVASRFDVHTTPTNDLIKALILMLDRMIEDEEMQVHGLSLIQDLQGISLSYTMALMRTDLIRKRQIIELIQDAFPVRFKGYHILRTPWYYQVVFTFVRPFLKQKILDRIHFHQQNLEGLHQSIDPAYLPEEFGGEQPLVSTKAIIKLFPELQT